MTRACPLWRMVLRAASRAKSRRWRARRRTMRGWLRGLTVTAILVASWAAASSLAHTPLAPGPVDVARSIVAGVRDGTLPRALATSVVRLLVGYAVALALGIPLGIALARSRVVK